jgi:hypothetical protein
MMCAGTCVDVLSDPKNCGTCGHDCLYGACRGATCQPWTVATDVSPTHGGQPFLLADGKYVVWDADIVLGQAPVAGGQTIPLSQSPIPYNGPALANGVVVFGNMMNLYQFHEGSSTWTDALAFPAGYSTPGRLALDPSAGTAYFFGKATAAPQAFDLIGCPLGGGACASVAGSVATSTMQPTVPWVTKTDVFWTTMVTSLSFQSINRYTFATGTITTLSTGTFSAWTLDATHIYWLDQKQNINVVPQTFQGNSTPTTVASIAGMTNVGTSLAVDGNNVYFTGLGGILAYLPVGGGTATTLYQSPSSGLEGSVIVAGGAVFWADGDLNYVPNQWNIMGLAAP